MKEKKIRKSFLRALVTSICCFSILLTFIGTAAAGAAAVSDNSVTASGSATLAQGSSGYCYIHIDSLENISSLNVEVHFDSSKIKVTSTYNSVSCTLQDSVIGNDSLNYSYIFDSNGSASKTRLFYFQYTVLSDATPGDTYFDIIITDAYDSSLNAVDVSGSRYKLAITEKTVSKSTTVSCSSSINTSVKEEFELSYRVGTNKIASGSFVISYDPELFEVISVTNGTFLDGKFTDVNTDLVGSVYVSFVGTEYKNNDDLLKVKFRTLKNKATASDIKLTVTEFCDLELNNYSCTGCTTKANISHDPTYTEDAPAMMLTPTYDASTGKVTALIQLDKDSHLGAGDFVVTFDASKLTYVSFEKGFAPSFFNGNL